MKINEYAMLSFASLFLLCLMNGCQSSSGTKSVSANQSAAQTATNANQPETPKAATDKSTTGSLSTPTETYKTAYALREKKDIEGLKRVLSKKLLGFLDGMAQAEKKTVDDELRELCEKPQAKTAETRNEKITGDTATLEYLDEDGQWSQMDFVKEGNDWKMTLPSEGNPPAKDNATKP